MLPQFYGLELVGYSPSEVSVELDKTIIKSIKVVAPDGFTLDKPRLIRVSGPKKVINEIDFISLKFNEKSNQCCPGFLREFTTLITQN